MRRKIAFWLLPSIVCTLVLPQFVAHPQILGAPPGGVTAPPPPPPPTCLGATIQKFAANPSTIEFGNSTVVLWSVSLPAECGAQVLLNGEPVTNNGSQLVSPVRSADFKLSVLDRNYVYTTGSVRVEVTYPSPVTITPATPHPEDVVAAALTDSNNAEQQVILSCNVVIEFNLHGKPIEITRNRRSLIASPECARGPRTPNQSVPLIRDKNAEERITPLFLIRSDEIRFSGFRLEGPTPGIGKNDHKEVGIKFYPDKCSWIDEACVSTPVRSIEFSNMEIYHWAGAGIQVADNDNEAVRGRLFNENPGAVLIKNNYFHHNQHYGEGYGVNVGGGAYALIEQNVFEAHRHAIAGGSRSEKVDFSGYTARDNLIRKGGGLHCNDQICDIPLHAGTWATVLYNPVTGLLGELAVIFGVACDAFEIQCWHTHQIDMHGDQNQWDFCVPLTGWCVGGHDHECGIAGETIIIERNTIFYDSGYAIRIRGNPVDKAVIRNNVFSIGFSEGNAIKQNGDCSQNHVTNPYTFYGNIFGVGDPTIYPIQIPYPNVGAVESAPCNFFGGEEQKDLFMATSVTWWALSHVTGQWYYLNTMPERLRELKLGDLDGDGVCDVAPQTQGRHPVYSKSGTSDWIPLGFQPF